MIKGRRNFESDDSPTYLRTSATKKIKNVTINPININDNSPTRTKAFNFGNSYEAPSYMKTKYSIIDHHSFDNPFLNNPNKWPLLSTMNNQLSNNNEFKFNEFNEKKKEITSFSLLKKFDPVNNKEKILKVNQNKKNYGDKKSEFQIKYNELMRKSPKSFNRKSGLFTTFVEKNNMMNVYGPLNEKDRNRKRINKKNENNLSISKIMNTTSNKIHSHKKSTGNKILEPSFHKRRVNTLCEDVLEINADKWLLRDQSYLNKINNNIIKGKIKSILGFNQKHEDFYYLKMPKMTKYFEKDNPIQEFEDKMLKLKSLYQKHNKELKKNVNRPKII